MGLGMGVEKKGRSARLRMVENAEVRKMRGGERGGGEDQVKTNEGTDGRTTRKQGGGGRMKKHDEVYIHKYANILRSFARSHARMRLQRACQTLNGARHYENQQIKGSMIQ